VERTASRVPADLNQLLSSAFELARSAVDLMAFSMGRSLTLKLEKVIDPEGRSAELRVEDLSLSLLCTAFHGDKIPHMIGNDLT
jgi:hypothetical protein